MQVASQDRGLKRVAEGGASTKIIRGKKLD